MKKFEFRLQPLLVQHRNRRDLLRQVLAGLFEQRRDLDARRERLQAERAELLSDIRRMSGPGPVDVERAGTRRYFAGQLSGRARLLERERSTLEEQLELCRKLLVEADQQVRLLEKMRDRLQAEHLAREAGREQREMEDLWQAAKTAEVAP